VLTELIGRKRLPSVKTLREVIGDGCAQLGDDVEQMKPKYARRCLEVWGYQGPVYEVLSDGFDDFRTNIEKIVGFLIEELGIERPGVIFDRGGFGWESFEKIEGRADFICWYDWKAKIPTDKWRKVKVPHASNIYSRLEYAEQEYIQQVISEGDEQGEGYRRMVFLKKGEKIPPAITNMKRATGKEVVIDGYDKIHSYRKAEYDAMYFESEGIDRERMMDNPVVRKPQAEKSKLENKRNVTLGRIAKREKDSGKMIKPTKQQQDRLDGTEFPRTHNPPCKVHVRMPGNLR
jgi:hypothetical protein